MKVRCCLGAAAFRLERAVCLALPAANDPLFPLTLAVLSLMLAALLRLWCCGPIPSCGYFHQQSKARSQSDAATSRSYLSSTAALSGYGGLMVAASVALASLLRGGLMVPAPEFAGVGHYLAGAHNSGDHPRFLVGLLRTGLGRLWFWDPVENASLLPWLSATARCTVYP